MVTCLKPVWRNLAPSDLKAWKTPDQDMNGLRSSNPFTPRRREAISFSVKKKSMPDSRRQQSKASCVQRFHQSLVGHQTTAHHFRFRKSESPMAMDPNRQATSTASASRWCPMPTPLAGNHAQRRCPHWWDRRSQYFFSNCFLCNGFFFYEIVHQKVCSEVRKSHVLH